MDWNRPHLEGSDDFEVFISKVCAIRGIIIRAYLLVGISAIWHYVIWHTVIWHTVIWHRMHFGSYIIHIRDGSGRTFSGFGSGRATNFGPRVGPGQSKNQNFGPRVGPGFSELRRVGSGFGLFIKMQNTSTQFSLISLFLSNFRVLLQNQIGKGLSLELEPENLLWLSFGPILVRCCNIVAHIVHCHNPYEE